MLVFADYHSLLNAQVVPILGRQHCGTGDYNLDVDARYERSKNKLVVTVKNPMPLIGFGIDIKLSDFRLYIYDGTRLIVERKQGRLNLKAGDSKTFTINTKFDDPILQSLTVVAQGTLDSDVGIGPVTINIDSGACGSDVIIIID
jgi:hypothetical protein